MKIYWQPQPKQAIALARIEDEIFYGGARGGGKTDAGLAWLLYEIYHPKYRALVIRRNADDLRDWIDRARAFYAPSSGEVVGNPPEIKFPKGGIIRTGHLKDDQAYTKYQGHEYQKILIEELPHISREDNYEKLLGSCRSTIPEIRPQLFATGNPDGAGFKWVKERWNIPDYPSEVVVSKTDDGRTRVFIPATVDDNSVLMEKDPGYVRFLESIKDIDLRNAWRLGHWTGISIKGAIYIAELQEMRAKGRVKSVPYDPALLVHTVWDLGKGANMAVGFYQKSGKNLMKIDYEEGEENEGLPSMIKKVKDKPYIYGKHFAPHDIIAVDISTEKSRYETAKLLGLKFETKTVNKKIQSAVPNILVNDGINAAKLVMARLWADEKKCKPWLDSMSQYRRVWDDPRGVYKDEPFHDWASHGADEYRYASLVEKYMTNEVERYAPDYSDLFHQKADINPAR